MTPKQLLFVSEYLKHGNATQAYMTAYGIADEDQAAANASRLIRNDKVARALQLHTATIMEQTKITVEDVIRRINHLADHAKDDYAKLKALDMLMKHLGGYMTLDDIISRMDETQAEKIAQKILSRISHEEK
jgi:phage terminase small subunit